MNKMNLEETQQKCLNILHEFDRFCQSEHLKYWLIGGSALGAVRHKGIIPWDDDIDVGMPRADYEAFLNRYKGVSSFEREDSFVGYGEVTENTNKLDDSAGRFKAKDHIRAVLAISSESVVTGC